MRLERFDVDLARETYLDAWGAAWFAGSLATAGDLLEVSRAARAAPPVSHPSQPFDLLLDATCAADHRGTCRGGVGAEARIERLRRGRDPAENSFRWTALPPIPSYVLWDDEGWYAINARQLGLAREAGALARLPMGLISRRGHRCLVGRVREGRGGDRGGRVRSSRRPGPASRPTRRCCSSLSRVGKPTASRCSSRRSTTPPPWVRDLPSNGASS